MKITYRHFHCRGNMAPAGQWSQPGQWSAGVEAVTHLPVTKLVFGSWLSGLTPTSSENVCSVCVNL